MLLCGYHSVKCETFFLFFFVQCETCKDVAKAWILSALGNSLKCYKLKEKIIPFEVQTKCNLLCYCSMGKLPLCVNNSIFLCYYCITTLNCSFMLSSRPWYGHSQILDFGKISFYAFYGLRHCFIFFLHNPDLCILCPMLASYLCITLHKCLSCFLSHMYCILTDFW